MGKKASYLKKWIVDDVWFNQWVEWFSTVSSQRGVCFNPWLL